MEVEANFGDGMFTKIMTPVFNKIHPCNITEIKNTKQKELRIIDTLEPVMMRHRLIVNQSVIEEDYRRYEQQQAYSFIYQLTRICRDKNALAHDDRLDAVTMAVAYWLESMDSTEEEEGKREEWNLEDVMRYGVLGIKTNKDRFSNIRNIRELTNT